MRKQKSTGREMADIGLLDESTIELFRQYLKEIGLQCRYRMSLQLSWSDN